MKTEVIYKKNDLAEGRAMFQVGTPMVPAEMAAKWANEYAEYLEVDGGKEVCLVCLEVQVHVQSLVPLPEGWRDRA